MTCAHAVRVAISKFDGVANVDVSLQRGHAKVELKPGNRVVLSEVMKAVSHQALEVRNVEIRARGRAVLVSGQWGFDIDGTKERIPLKPLSAANLDAGDWKLTFAVAKKSKRAEPATLSRP